MNTEKEKLIPAIICTGETGRAVVFGYVSALPQPEQPVTIKDARMIIRWDKNGLFGLACEGPKGDTRISGKVPVTTCTAKQAIECTKNAALAIKKWEAWR